MPDVRVVFSCQWLHKTDPAKPCSDSHHRHHRPSKAGNAALVTTVAAGTNGTSLATTYQTSAAYLDVTASAANTQGLFWWSKVSGDPVPVNSPFPLLCAPLPAADNLIKADVPDDPVNNPPEHVTSKPIRWRSCRPRRTSPEPDSRATPRSSPPSHLHQRLDHLDLQQSRAPPSAWRSRT